MTEEKDRGHNTKDDWVDYWPVGGALHTVAEAEQHAAAWKR